MEKNIESKEDAREKKTLASAFVRLNIWKNEKHTT